MCVSTHVHVNDQFVVHFFCLNTCKGLFGFVFADIQSRPAIGRRELGNGGEHCFLC